MSTRHTGDDGTTQHSGLGRVSKASAAMDALGDLDELNASVGWLASQLPPSCASARPELEAVQRTLVTIGTIYAELPVEDWHARLTLALEQIECAVANYGDETGPLVRFVLPEGHPASSAAHVARTVCRRAERSLVRFSDAAAAGGSACPYLNRLSTYLFALARVVNAREGKPEVTV